MNEKIIDALYDYMTYTLKVNNDKALEDTANEMKAFFTEEQYIEVELYINLLISTAEKQGFRRAFQLFF